MVFVIWPTISVNAEFESKTSALFLSQIQLKNMPIGLQTDFQLIGNSFIYEVVRIRYINCSLVHLKKDDEISLPAVIIPTVIHTFRERRYNLTPHCNPAVVA